MRRSFWTSLTARGRLVDDGPRWVKWWPVWSIAASVAERGKGKSEVGGRFLGDVRSSGKGGQSKWGSDDWWPPTSSTLCAMSTSTRNKGGAWDRATISGSQMETGR
jgi:hypothetical protein